MLILEFVGQVRVLNGCILLDGDSRTLDLHKHDAPLQCVWVNVLAGVEKECGVIAVKINLSKCFSQCCLKPGKGTCPMSKLYFSVYHYH